MIKNNCSTIISKETPFFTHLVDSDDFIEHSHTHIELFYIVSGDVTHVLNSKEQKLELGDLVVILPNDTHYFKRPATAVHRDIFFSEQFLQETLNHLKLDFNKLYNILNQHFFHLSLEQIKVLESFSKNFIHEFLLNKKRVEITTNLITTYLMYILYFDTNIYNSLVFNTNSKWLTELIERFETPALLQQGLSKIISNLHYNKVYINNMFKKHIGKSLSEYLAEKRLEYAILYMEIYNYSLETISEKLGFCSLSYFFKQFKKKYGMPPREYMKQKCLTPNK